MLTSILADFTVIFERDPAARNVLEVLFCYPGLQALLFHRVAHGLWRLGLPFIPRLISHWARFLTGVEIHPGASIGSGVFIDHGMGVVIGETAIVGDYCLIYQGVTLGGTGKESGKRHPTLGENVVIGAGAKVLGNIQLGNNVRVGAGSVVLRDVPSDCTVVGIPGRIVYRAGTKVDPLEHGQLPDSEAKAIRVLLDRIDALEQQVQVLQAEHQAGRQAERLWAREEAERRMALTAAVGLSAAEVAMGSPGGLEMPLEAPALTFERAMSAPAAQRNQCYLKDREVEAFLDGSGI